MATNCEFGIGEDDIVLPEEAMHHNLRTGTTDSGETWLWCETCGAHSNERVCNLAKPCKGTRNNLQKCRLQQGSHPYTGEANALQPQKLQWKTADAQAVVSKIRQGVDKDAAVVAQQQAEREEQHEQAARHHFQEQMDDARDGLRPEDSDEEGDDAVAWLLGHREQS